MVCGGGSLSPATSQGAEVWVVLGRVELLGSAILPSGEPSL